MAQRDHVYKQMLGWREIRGDDCGSREESWCGLGAEALIAEGSSE